MAVASTTVQMDQPEVVQPEIVSRIDGLAMIPEESRHDVTVDEEHGVVAADASPVEPLAAERSVSDGDTSTSASSLPMQEHLGKHRQYWRDILLGVNDGIISTFLLVAGVAGGGLSSQNILLTAIAGTVAGAVSMCAGEFVATKSQNEVLEGEIKLERSHVQHFHQEELKELSELLQVIGIPKEEVALRQHLLQYYDRNPESMLQAMICLEFGVLEEETRSPMIAGMANLLLFAVGAMPSVLPFAFAEHAQHGLITAAVFTVAALLLVGAIKTWATRGNCVTASVENLIIAVIGGGLAYGVGLFFNSIVK